MWRRLLYNICTVFYTVKNLSWWITLYNLINMEKNNFQPHQFPCWTIFFFQIFQILRAIFWYVFQVCSIVHIRSDFHISNDICKSNMCYQSYFRLLTCCKILFKISFPNILPIFFKKYVYNFWTNHSTLHWIINAHIQLSDIRHYKIDLGLALNHLYLLLNYYAISFADSGICKLR